VNVYVESNFVLELALLQEQSASCEELVDLGAKGLVSLVVPAYCLAEPYETLIRRWRDRLGLKRTVDGQLTQLARTSTYSDHLERFSDITSLLVSSADEEQKRLEDVLSKILELADVIPLDSEVMAESIRCQEEYDFGPQDAIVFASIVSDLKSRSAEHQSCFLNRNPKDFADQNVLDQLDQRGCKLFPRFDSGLAFIRNRLEATSA